MTARCGWRALAGFVALTPPLWAAEPSGTTALQALQQQVGALDARLEKIEDALRQNRSMLGLLNEIEALKAELAKLRGMAEVQAHQIDTLDKRQSDLYADLDQRMNELARADKAAPASDAAPGAAAGVAAPAATGEPGAEALAESRDYEAALKQFREGQYAGAIAGFKGFLKTYPASALAANAQYWIGYSYYALKDYKSALAQQQKLVVAYPASAKVPDALLNVAANQIALKRLPAARATLEGLVAKYPGTPAAAQASRRLAALK
jgi:tol-pal system protein YbgF